MRKIVALILSLVMVLSLVGCKTQNVSNSKDLEVEMMVVNDNNVVDDSNFMIKKIFKDKFNIDVKLNQNISGTHFEKLKLLIASNQLPDIVSPLPIDEAKKIGVKGALVPVDEHLDIMPNLKNYIKSDVVAYTSLFASDNHIYVAPKFTEQPEYKGTPIIRADMVKAVGREMPATMTELIDTLKAIKQKYPDVVGLVNRNKEAALGLYGIMYNTAVGMMYDNSQDKWVYGPLNEGYKEMVNDFKTLFDEGLLDKEFFTASSEQWEEKLLNNKGVFTLDWPNRAQVEEDLYKTLHPEDSVFDLKLLMPLTTNSNTSMRLLQSESFSSYLSYGISSKTKDAERLLTAIDYLYSDEGAELMQWGEKDKHYFIENGKKKYMDYIKTSYNPDATENIASTEGINAGHFTRVIKNDGLSTFPQEVQDMSEIYKKEVECFEDNYKIKLNFTTEQLDRIRVINNNIETKLNEITLKAIINELPISEFYDELNLIKDNGATELEQIYADAYELFKKQMSEVKQ